jgi:hypothetical protein
VFLAFPGEQSPGFVYFDVIMNIFFLLDIVINFRSAYSQSDFKVVDKPKVRRHTFKLSDYRQRIPAGLVYY